MGVTSTHEAVAAAGGRRVFYGWYIVTVGFIANIASAFALASTLSVFLKPLTAELGVSRGVFSLLRSGEGIIAACMAPLIGSLADRYGGRWMMALGAIVAGTGYIALSYVESFWQFLLLRWSLVTVGDAFMGYMVINIVIAHWFYRRRGRAIAFSGMGIGFTKVFMPVAAASLILWLGWRGTWLIFGLVTILLVVGPALLIVRRSPEEIGLYLDGESLPATSNREKKTREDARHNLAAAQDIIWSRSEALRTPAFWLLVVIFGVSSIGVTGLNLHVFAYVSDLGHSPVVAATVMSVIASMQLASPLVWGLIAERIDLRTAAMYKFIIQGTGLALAITTPDFIFLYAGFLLYGIGLGGNMVLSETLWANYFGRQSFGKVRGLGLLLTQGLAALGPPFFGFLFDVTGGYGLSFAIFVGALLTSAVLSLLLRPPIK
jgi:MFS family permease